MRGLVMRIAGIGAALLCASAPALSAENSQYKVHGEMPYSAFEKLDRTKISLRGGDLNVAFAPGDFTIGKDKLLKWIKRSGDAISIFYGRFPLKSARVLIVPVNGKRTSGGQAFGNGGAAVRVMVGRDITEEGLAKDWQLPHEMVHLTFPSMPNASWISEGLAVYVEPIARVQSGELTDSEVWSDFVKNLPTGLPQAGEKGFGDDERRERTYWGGALFWLIADIDIRKRTNNRVGVQDALRGVAAKQGNIERFWKVERALEIADEATGEHVLSEMYATWKASAVSLDLDALWTELGIVTTSRGVTFDDTAPLAAIRKAITTPVQ